MIIGTRMVPPGKVVLMRDGKIVWMGNLSDPWDDAICDHILVSLSDYRGFANRVQELLDEDDGV